MASNLKIYPSGFLGSAAVAQTQPKDLVAVAKQIFNRSYIPRSNPYTASLEVLDLWTTLLNDEKAHQSFEFKEKILKAALTHFGEVRFLDWVRAQWTSPEYGDNHSRWIDETVEFVFTGKRRGLSTNGWCVILTAGENDTGLKTFSPTIKKCMMNGSFLTNRSNINMVDFITAWVRQPNGINDLLNSLQVLYGVR